MSAKAQKKPTWLVLKVELVETAPDLWRITFANRKTGEQVNSDIKPVLHSRI